MADSPTATFTWRPTPFFVVERPSYPRRLSPKDHTWPPLVRTAAKFQPAATTLPGPETAVFGC